jgi:hypothetical protein
MAKRLPAARLLRGLLKNGIVTDKKEIALIQTKMKSPKTQIELNRFYTINKGSRWVDRLKIWGLWLVKHQDTIFSILGIAVLILDDGKRVLVDANDVDPVIVTTVVKPEVPTETPDGEKVIAFTEAAKELNKKTAKAIPPVRGMYDIGIIKPNPVEAQFTNPDLGVPHDEDSPQLDEDEDIDDVEWFDIADEWDDDPSEELPSEVQAVIDAQHAALDAQSEEVTE